ncbi:MAG TPA: penicillin acylase family protein [Longimicrobiales bacterium]|nr:penicillin acylase family protein [Longimicrobiales bacterium]
MSRRNRSHVALLVLATATAACGGPPPAASLEDLATRSLAQIDGALTVQGLQAPVEVIRDEWGIPHIYAENTHDLFFAQGYVMAQDRLWQMEMWRRWREGRLAEIFGPAALPYDARVRLMMYRGPFDDTEWSNYHPEAEAIFTAYADGVNAYVAQNRDNLPAEFQLTGTRPDPWTAETVVLRWAALAVPSVRGHAINEVQLAMNVARYGAEEANRRAAPDPYEELVVPDGLDVSLFTEEMLAAMRAGDGDPFEPGELPPLEIVEEYRGLMPAMRAAQVSPEMETTEGSNNWVMSGERTPTGIPILANDPHRRIEMPALRYFVHLVAPGWNVIGGGEPPFVGVMAGSNERMAWGFTFAGTDMVDVFVEELHPDQPDMVRYGDAWEPLRVIREEIAVKGEAPHIVELKFSRHGPVFYEDLERRRAFSVQSVVQYPGTAAYLGSFKLAQAESCESFFERAMFWKVPTHNLICGDVDGNIALQVTGLTPDRDGWNGRLPVPGTGQYEWEGFREDLPREWNPERGYIVTANNNTTQPPGYEGRPVYYHSSRGVETSRITRLHQILGSGDVFTVEDHKRIQFDAHSLQAARDIPSFRGWTSSDPDVEWARALLAEWDGYMTDETTAGAIYVRWTDEVDDRARSAATPAAERRSLIEEGLAGALDRLSADWGADRTQWRYGRIHSSAFPHMLVSAFDLPAVERPGGFGTVNATGANFRRIIDLANLDRSVGTNAPGQSAQPGSPFYDNLVGGLVEPAYFPLLFSRRAVEEGAAHTLMLQPDS